MKTNKHGQAIGRKGAESRRRLLDATRSLIAVEPPHRLTASGIARAAQLASQTFYLYFRDIDEALLTLCDEAGADMNDVREALDPRDDATPLDRARRFIDAYTAYWDRHRAVLTMRNYLSDSGHAPFLATRQSVSLPLIEAIAATIMSAHQNEGLGHRAAFARGVVIFSAIERMAARPPRIEGDPRLLEREDLTAAEIDILTLLFTPDLARPVADPPGRDGAT